ncbi:MAG: SusC/RagA family TonB-linked outer membrane protein [Capnocytophaga sp.]|nr:SusC/RagA family TonB-linked outer membrane protein [Capnocytophaga sp.]
MKIFIYIFFFFSILSFAQQNHFTIKGYVKDNEGGLMGVTVQIEGTTLGTTTNADGYYELSFQKEINNPIISFSFIGKKTKKIPYSGTPLLNVTLEDDILTLEGVQVTAKTNINAIDSRAKTANIESIAVAEIKDIPQSNIALSLQGKITGLQIINRGELGTLPEIRIRGTSSLRRGDSANEPLYILDGKMISAETFFYLNSENIREIKVLKDAVASALYGIKAANGVIEITSKQGGEKALNFHVQSGVTFASSPRMNMMNSSEKLELERLLRNPNTPGYKYSEEYITFLYSSANDYQERLAEGKQKLDSLRNINTNWYKELSSMQTFQKYDISVRNGNEKTAYFVSLGYMQQGGQLQGNDISRITSQISIDQTLSKNAITTLSVNGSLATNNTPNGGEFSPEQLIYDLNPYETKQSQEFYSYPRYNFETLFNQFSRKNTNKNLGASLSLNWKVTPSLEISAVTGLDFSLSETLIVIPETAISQTTKGIPTYARGRLEQSKNTFTNITSNLRINYEKTLGKHHLTLGANADNYTSVIDNLNISGQGVFGKAQSANSIDNSLEGAYSPKVGGQKQTERNIGIGGLVGYTYDDTYNLFATYKVDASSVLPTSKRWNAAWALGASINLKSYNFLQKIEWLSSLDLRSSFGQTANAQGISPALITATFTYKPINYNNIRLMEIVSLPNQNLRAEQNKIIDVGISATLWKTTIQSSFYKRTTKDALLEIPIASSSGFISQLQNIGVLENTGIECSLTQSILSNNTWNIRLGGTISYNQNKVIDLYGKDRIYTSNAEDALPDYEVGQSIDALFGLYSLGINPITGLPDFVNQYGEQVSVYNRMTPEDYVYLGKTTPPYNGNFFLNISYKKLLFEMNFYYALGGVKPYSNSYIRNSQNAHKNAAQNQLADMWWKSGDENKIYPTAFRSSSADYNISLPNTRTVVKTDFLRLSNVSLKYQFDSEQLSRISKSLRYMTLGINAANLATFTRYKDSNPETNNIINPLPATVTFNINFVF